MSASKVCYLTLNNSHFMVYSVFYRTIIYGNSWPLCKMISIEDIDLKLSELIIHGNINDLWKYGKVKANGSVIFDLRLKIWRFYWPFCKIVNIKDIALKFSGSSFDVNAHQLSKFREAAILKKCIFSSQLITKRRILQTCNLQTRRFLSNFCFDSLPPYQVLHLVKISRS